jgi:hypothetical protein
VNSIYFENRYVFSRDDLHEIYNATTFHTRWFSILAVIFTVSCLANLPGLIDGKQKELLQIISNICWFLIIIFVLIIRTHLAIKKYFNQVNDLFHGARVENIIRIGDDYEIVNELTGSSLHIKFSQIIKFREIKTYFVLMTSSRYPIYIRKDCFTLGSLDEFVEFICRNYPTFRFSKKKKKLREMSKS